MKPERSVTIREIKHQAAILDALPAHIALLDAEGIITSVNRAWHQFGDANGMHSPGHEVGINYLAICDNARGKDAMLAHRAATGIRSVLDARALSFSMEYPCHSPIQQLWFVMTATPLADGRHDGVLVMHQNVTTERLAEANLRASELRFRQVAENIRDVFYLQDVFTDRVLYISPSYAEIWGRSCESLYADPQSWIDAIHPDDRVSIEEKYRAGLSSGRIEYEYRIVRPDGSIRWLQSRGFPVRDDAGAIVRLAGVVKDITERKQASQELRESESRFTDMLGRIRLASVMLDCDGRITYCNAFLLQLTGWTLEEVIGLDWFETFVPAELGDLKPVFKALLADSPQAWHVENELYTRSRERRLFRWNNSVLHSGSGAVIGVASIGEDITEQKQAELKIERLNRVYAVLSQINALVVRVRDRDELFREACRIAVETGGFRMAMIAMVDQATQKIVPIAISGKDEELLQAIRIIFASDEKVPTTMAAKGIRDKIAIVSNDLETDPRALLRENYIQAGVRSLAILPLIVSGEAVGFLTLYSREKDFFHDEEMRLLTGLSEDVAFAIDHIEKEEKLTYLAYYDATTGLANQTLFLKRLQEKLLSSQPGLSGKAVFVLDIERFKTINDTFGQKAGDDLLRQIAERLVQAGDGDASRFARLGADRFVIFASDMDNAEQVDPYVEQRLSATFNRQFRIRDNDLHVSAKVGIALFPDDGWDAETLLRNAEVALKKAKSTGERYLFFNQAMTERVAERLLLENRLRQALDNEEFVLHYQPKLNLATRELTGAEALIRWNDPRTGLVPPGMFIPILEETGLIHEVGRWAMRKAVVDYLRWRSIGLNAVRIAVNVSPLQLRNRGFVAEIGQVLSIDPHAAAGLELEITESLIMEDVKHSIAILQAIRAMGVTVAIDDFGTGFSSLSYLSKLPMDTLKIDRAFVNDMTVTPQGLALVSTIINLAHSLQHKVVAEGVETDEQWRLLQSLVCDEMQGFLISKPLPTELFEAQFLFRQAGK